MSAFLAGFIVGVIGMTAIYFLLRLQSRPRAAAPKSEGNVPHTDTASASQIGHDRGIEVFDD